MDLDDEELSATRKLNGVVKDNIEETKKNIESWENEVQEALKNDDIMKAIGCRILANHLRKNIGEEEI